MKRGAERKEGAMQLSDGLTITWLGHAAFRIQSPGGKVLYIDPWLENPRAPADARPVARADGVLVTHGHFDHLGNAVEIAQQTGAPVVGSWEVSVYLNGKGIENAIGMNKGGTVEVAGLAVTMVSADHSSGILEGDRVLNGGEAAGYVVRFENGFTLYHAGDTNVFGDMKLIGELYRPDLALLPIGGHFTMGPREAAYAVRLLGVKAVLPMHYGTFPVLKGTPEELRTQLEGVDVEVVALAPGQTLR
jgi:L-ascorbate metabolism protein UlaG (beta-lactamase superfamily)